MGKQTIKQAIENTVNEGNKAFVPYIMAGDPSLDDLKSQLLFLQEAGATVIELGLPFSDPVADGPTIQDAGIRALENGTTVKKVLAELKAIRSEIHVPIVLMTYINPLFKYGLTTFFTDSEEAGVDGVIIPDVPLEQRSLIEEHMNQTDIALIQLVTLTSPEERVKRLAKASEGFLYAVTVTGITGARSAVSEKLESFIYTLKKHSSVPVLAGFGISTPDQVKEIASLGDGVIVGSRIVDLLHQKKKEEIKELIQAAVGTENTAI
ncbi:tryptophan synthase subunit alpha [Jeotgalibacillus proteolyticus]|uniref:Tryptophan synthase alpha chain n=1 Tax=Jeotgalibacillus proteolyticus TaxID=2082395 RepID=A0A2S5GG29_9BACL|nr:tryptophan synthase subunit alpha [Jeotgalibacillus proteolyticus]PPA71823.1 tryptophan synthase subunit alpha [Jeotgalibacillus proteolyticus]